MAQTGYTPIQIYHSATASAAPVAGNLTDGELAINITDGKLYYKDNTGAVQLLADKNIAGLTLPLSVANGGTSYSSYVAGEILYASGTTALSKLTLGTTGYVMVAGASAPEYVAQSTLSVGKATNIAGGATGSLMYQSSADTTSFLSLGTTNYVLIAGASAPQYVAQSTLSVGNATTATTAGTATNIVGGANGSIPYQTGSGSTTMLAAGTNGQVLTLASGVPTWAAATGGASTDGAYFLAFMMG